MQKSGFYMFRIYFLGLSTKCTLLAIYWVVHKLPQMYTANHATFPIQIRTIMYSTDVRICIGKFA